MNSRKASTSNSGNQRRPSEGRSASASSTASSTSCSLSVTESIIDTDDSGWRSSPVDRTRRYGFHRAATVLEKDVVTEGWNGGARVGGKPLPKPIWPSIRVQLPKTVDSSLVVPVYLSKRERERCKVGEALYSSPQAGRIISAETFKNMKRAKRSAGVHAQSKSLAEVVHLPDEVKIVQSWSPGQVFTPRTYKWMAVVRYAGKFVSLTPGTIVNGNKQYLPHFAESSE